MQETLERALATVLRAPVALTVAGRTDTGVHASGQVAHADLPTPLDPKLVTRLAGLLPPDVRVRAVTAVPDAFDARYSGLWRRYEYRVSDDPSGVAPLRRAFVLDRRRPLDAAAMHESAQAMLGLRDFVAFCKWRDTGTTIRAVQRFDVARDTTGGGAEVVVTIQADAFCHSMVRSLVGALLLVGEGRRDIGWPASLLSASARSNEITVAPARGLTLCEVGYPPDEELAARQATTRATRLPDASS